MNFTNNEAIEHVKEEAVKQIGKSIEEMNDGERDSVWVEFESGDECSLVGRISIDEDSDVWFMIEDDGAVEDTFDNFEEAQTSYQVFVEEKSKAKQ